MTKKIGRIAEIIILILGVLVAAAFAVIIPLNSYNEYAAYLERVEELNKPVLKPVLQSITVELKEGVRYFANDLAEPREEDFLVMANYKLGEEAYSEPVEEGKFDISTENHFYAVGGDVTVTYRGKKAVVNIELVPVVLEGLSVVQSPYNVKYQAGTVFDISGLILQAVYNDGSSKLIPSEKYEIESTEALTTADSTATVSYTEGEEKLFAHIPISVVEVLNNGAITALALVGDAIVQAGDTLDDTAMEIHAIYESGNRMLLEETEYAVSGRDVVAKFGKAYRVSVTYNEDPSLRLDTGVIVRATVQGESGVIVGGSQKTEAEFAVIDGVITQLGNHVTFAGDFAKTVLNGREGSLTLTVNSESAVVGSITMRCGNSYCCFVNGSNANNGYIMQPLQINTILDLSVNGEAIEIPSSVVLKGSGPHAGYAPLFGIYYEFTFENIALEAGANTIKFTFKSSTAGVSNCWGESPSTLNIDYVNFDTKGNDIPETYSIDQIEISPNYTVAVGTLISNIKPPIIATIAGGVKIVAPAELFNITVSGGEAGSTTTSFGKYKITATLKSDPSVTATREIELVGLRVLKASVELEGDKVYYVFSGTSYGYTAEDLQFFDNAKIFDLITEFTDTTFTFKIDVTHLTPGTVVYPHLRLKGEVYANGSNSNGDILGNGLTFSDGQSVTLNGQTYTIVREWSMPTLRVAAEESD